MKKMENIITSDHDDDHSDVYSRIESKPNWDKFDWLVAVAEVERIEEQQKERKLRQDLSTLLEQDTDESFKNASGVKWQLKGTEESVKISTGFRLGLPLCQFSGINKGKRLLRKKIRATDRFSKLDLMPQFRGGHQEKDGKANGDYLFSLGNIIKKPCKRLRYNEENSAQEKLPRPKKAKKTTYVGGTELPTITEEFEKKIKELGGSESKLDFVCQKVLTDTDVSTHHQRLLIPFKQVKNEFLTDEEKGCFQDSRHRFEIDAILIDPALDECRINLRQWKMQKRDPHKLTSYYSLVTHWKNIVLKNKLKTDDTVQLWAFRRESKLGFALAVVN